MTPIFGVGDAATALRVLPERHAMVSFAFVGTTWVPTAKLDQLLATCASISFDSGAFSAWSRGSPVDPGAYAAFLEVHRDRYRFALNLDVIGDAVASAQQWEAYRAQGIETVPVFHEGSAIDLLDAYEPAQRLVALGRIAGRRSKAATLAFYDQVFNAHPAGRFHALGVSSPEVLEPYPFDSFDAVSWQRDAGYAQSHGWPWSACSRETRLRAYVEAIETIKHRPRQDAQLSLFGSRRPP